MNRISAGIKSACKAVTDTASRFNGAVNTGLNTIGVSQGSENIIKTTLCVTIFKDIIYPVLQPIILKKVPQLAVSAKLVESFGESLQAVQKAAVISSIMSISYTMRSQAASKLQADGQLFIIPELMKKNNGDNRDDEIKEPSISFYDKKIIDKITDYESVITNNTVTDNRKKEDNVQFFIFHGLAGTGKTKITNYLAHKLNNSTDGTTIRYAINSGHLTKQTDWQLNQIISYINENKTTTEQLKEEFEKTHPHSFDTKKDAIVIEFDEIDQLDQDKMARLQGFYDKLRKTGAKVLFMGTTNFPDKIPEALKSRAGEILEIGLPSTDKCKEILEKFCESYTELTINIDKEQTVKIEIEGLAKKLQAKIDNSDNSTDDENPLGLSVRDIQTAFDKTADSFNTKIVKKQTEYITGNKLSDVGLDEIAAIFEKKLKEIIDNKNKKTTTNT